MNVRVDPETLAALAGELEQSSSKLAHAQPAPEADAGPSGPAVNETLAELMRAAAGLAEETAKTADALHSGKAVYLDTDAANADQINQIRPR
ncbi:MULTISPECIES: hypothetical protein [Saccharopolyspora]|uniref:hypothetical protein n=1 Tax=Saccharopolyspora TaxID=1835 RepID=UPI001FB5CE79|nr:hypothetical protein [Saccharopolyspora gloriosae]